MALPVGRKALLDTNVFIDFLRADLHGEWIFGGREPVFRFVSAVVFLELYLGADTPKRKAAVDRVAAAFPNSRVIAPAPWLYPRAANLFQSLYRKLPPGRDRLGPINDLLIALTAREIGAVLITSNLQEFQRIGEELPALEVRSP